MASYLKTALSENFQVGVSSKAIVEKHRRDRETILSAQRAQDEKLEQLRKAYDYYLSKEISKLIPNLTQTIKHEIFTEFEQYLGSGVYLTLFQKEGLDNVLVLDRFTAFLRLQHPNMLDVMMPFDDYLKKLSANI